MISQTATIVDQVYRDHWGRIVATLISSYGDFDLAEDAAQEAFTAAVDQWPKGGIPDSPAAWIIQTARHNPNAGAYRCRTESHLPRIQ